MLMTESQSSKDEERNSWRALIIYLTEDISCTVGWRPDKYSVKSVDVKFDSVFTWRKLSSSWWFVPATVWTSPQVFPTMFHEGLAV